ncbi:MAG TPA: SDR family oxidoreductase [Gemmatimonadaceae bacterium]|nr:SDR family oxidoreductase [Gemmatimonadaceae bacterium]
MDLQLNGKTALVSGSTLGIGLAIASTLAREGATVIVNGRTQTHVDEAIARITKDNPNAKLRSAAGDLSTVQGIESVDKSFPDVDILVNSLGAFEAKSFFDITDADWQHMWDVNVVAGVRLSRQYMRGMLGRNWGRIIFISSEAALNLSGAALHYGVTKTAVLGLSRGLAELTVGTAVTVNAVLPGPTRTEAMDEWLKGLAQQKGLTVSQAERNYFDTERPASLIRRFADPSEIAALVAYVASPLSAVTNGASLRADGGIIHSIG